jgi:cell division protein FtsA
MKDHVLVGLDLGTSHIRIAVGQVVATPEKRSALHVIGAVEVPSQGIAKGSITSLEDVVSVVSQCLEQAERVVGLPIGEATVGIGGTGVVTQDAKGVVGVSRADGEIRPEDVTRAFDSARAFINPANQEILHVLPRTFTIDGQRGIKDPVGMQGIRLEVDVHLIQGISSHVRNITKAVFRTGLDIAELVYSPLAVAEAITSSRERELGVCIVCIGASTTGIAVYEGGELLQALTVPLGADHITSDLAIGLRISLDAAERLKCSYGTALPETIPTHGGDVTLRDIGADSDEVVPLRFVSEIIEARAEELFERIGAELKKIDREGMLPAGIVLTGGGAKLPGMVEVAKRVLRLPCSLGSVHLASSMPEVIQDPAFSTVVGLVSWAYDMERRDQDDNRPRTSIGHKGGEFMSKLSVPFKKLFKSFVP